MKHRKLIIVLAYFDRYLYLPLVLVLSVILHLFTSMNFFFYGGIGILAFAIYELVSYLCHSVVYYCAYQNANHVTMTPENVNWGAVKKSDAYGIPAIFGILGTAFFVYSFFI